MILSYGWASHLSRHGEGGQFTELPLGIPFAMLGVITAGGASNALRLYPEKQFMPLASLRGAFLPQAVQYIPRKNGDMEDLRDKWPQITDYFKSALIMIQKRWQSENNKGLVEAAAFILGTIGTITVIDALFPDKDKEGR